MLILLYCDATQAQSQIRESSNRLLKQYIDGVKVGSGVGGVMPIGEPERAVLAASAPDIGRALELANEKIDAAIAEFKIHAQRHELQATDHLPRRTGMVLSQV